MSNRIIMSINFRLKKDWFLETDLLGLKNKTLIFEEGHIFKPTENGEYHIIFGGWSEENTKVGGRMILSEEEMSKAEDNGELLFEIEKPKQNIEIVIQEVPEDDDVQIKNWRIQLDVKTTRKKLKEVERMINEKVIPLL